MHASWNEWSASVFCWQMERLVHFEFCAKSIAEPGTVHGGLWRKHGRWRQEPHTPIRVSQSNNGWSERARKFRLPVCTFRASLRYSIRNPGCTYAVAPTRGTSLRVLGNYVRNCSGRRAVGSAEKRGWPVSVRTPSFRRCKNSLSQRAISATRLNELDSRVTLKLLTLPPPFRTKTKDLFTNLRFNYFKVFIVGVGSFFRPFQPSPEERKKVNFWRDLNVALIPSSTFLRVKTAIPCVLSLNFVNKEE